MRMPHVIFGYVLMKTFAGFLLGASGLFGQSVRGAVDVHVHCDPDVIPRSVDGLEAARLAKEHGMRALVLKNHYVPTAGLAYLAQKLTPGVEVFGGIALNRPVGGVNPAAVENMVRMKGGRGRVVWMPTFDSENAVRQSKEPRPFVSVSRGGRLLPEVLEILDLIAEHDLVLATGHSSPEECLMLIREARKRGVQRIMVTHAMMAPIQMGVVQMQEAAKLGAFVEFADNGMASRGDVSGLEDYAQAIRAIGPEHCILSSDLGQAANPVPPAGLQTFLEAMAKQGLSEAEIDRMVKQNPATLLGLD